MSDTAAAKVESEDRGEFKDRRPPKSLGQKAAIMLIMLAAIALLGYGAFKTLGIFSNAKQQAVTQQVEEQKRPETTPEFNVSLADSDQQQQQPQAAVECPGGLRLPPGMACPPEQQPNAAPGASPGNGNSEEDIVAKRRLSGDVSVASRDEAGSGAATNAGAEGHSNGLNGATNLGSQLMGTATLKTSATINRNPSYTLAKGTLPDCTLITAISSDQPGFLKCILSRPVYSMDGKVILMEAGTTFEGEYQASVARGKKRMFAIWTRAITPNFVEIELNSPTTDALGRSGMDGEIDNHYWERFSGAMLYSLFSDYTDYLMQRQQQRSQERQAALAAQNSNGNGSSSISLPGVWSGNNFSRTQSTADRIVEALLTQGEDIEPTLYKNQGEIIKIYVARDVDFSRVYRLKRNPRE